MSRQAAEMPFSARTGGAPVRRGEHPALGGAQRVRRGQAPAERVVQDEHEDLGPHVVDLPPGADGIGGQPVHQDRGEGQGLVVVAGGEVRLAAAAHDQGSGRAEGVALGGRLQQGAQRGVPRRGRTVRRPGAPGAGPTRWGSARRVRDRPGGRGRRGRRPGRRGGRGPSPEWRGPRRGGGRRPPGSGRRPGVSISSSAHARSSRPWKTGGRPVRRVPCGGGPRRRNPGRRRRGVSTAISQARTARGTPYPLGGSRTAACQGTTPRSPQGTMTRRTASGDPGGTRQAGLREGAVPQPEVAGGQGRAPRRPTRTGRPGPAASGVRAFHAPAGCRCRRRRPQALPVRAGREVRGDRGAAVGGQAGQGQCRDGAVSGDDEDGPVRVGHAGHQVQQRVRPGRPQPARRSPTVASTGCNTSPPCPRSTSRERRRRSPGGRERSEPGRRAVPVGAVPRVGGASAPSVGGQFEQGAVVAALPGRAGGGLPPALGQVVLAEGRELVGDARRDGRRAEHQGAARLQAADRVLGASGAQRPEGRLAAPVGRRAGDAQVAVGRPAEQDVVGGEPQRGRGRRPTAARRSRRRLRARPCGGRRVVGAARPGPR